MMKVFVAVAVVGESLMLKMMTEESLKHLIPSSAS